MADKKSSVGNPGWLKWLVTAFIAYAVYMHFTGQNTGATAPEESGKAGVETGSRKAYTPPAVTGTDVKIGGDIQGSGDEAQCGQTATLSVLATLPDGTDYAGDAAPSGPLEVKVGAQDETRPWLVGLPGMSSGGVREILVPVEKVLKEEEAEKAGFAKKDNVRFRVQLKELRPAADRTAIPLRVMDTLPDRGQMAYCGDTVHIHLVLWGDNGTVLYDSSKKEPIELRLGDASVFYGLDRALLGMRAGGVRTAIIPPAYLTGKGDHPAFKALPEGKIAIADISLIDVVKPR